MAQAKSGDTVKVNYTGTLTDGTVFDSSKEREPLEFTIGKGQIIPGFENAVVGMKVGETKNVSLAKDEAYGDYVEEAKAEVEKSALPEHISPEVGQMLQVTMQDGNVANVTITEVGDETITLDSNHPLAGKELNFEITLEEIAE